MFSLFRRKKQVPDKIQNAIELSIKLHSMWMPLAFADESLQNATPIQRAMYSLGALQYTVDMLTGLTADERDLVWHMVAPADAINHVKRDLPEDVQIEAADKLFSMYGRTEYEFAERGYKEMRQVVENAQHGDQDT